MKQGTRPEAATPPPGPLLRVTVSAMTRAVVCALILTAAMTWTDPVRAENQCSCPKIAADGKGNSSCSAAESNNRCTIDFNLFAERETRAVNVLRTLVPQRTIPDANPTLNTLEALSRAEAAQQLGPTIFVFLMVAAIDQRSAFPQNIPDGAVREIANIFFNADVLGAVTQAFSRDGARNFLSLSDEDLRRQFSGGNQPRPIYQRNDVTISGGCVSIRAPSGPWVMYKTPWSEARVLPWCTNQRP